MVYWPLSKDGQSLALLARFHVLVLTKASPMHLHPPIFIDPTRTSPANCWETAHAAINNVGPGGYSAVKTMQEGYVPIWIPNPGRGAGEQDIVSHPATLVATHVVPTGDWPGVTADKSWYLYHQDRLIDYQVFLNHPEVSRNFHLVSKSPQTLPRNVVTSLRVDATPFVPGQLHGKARISEQTKAGNETAAPQECSKPTFSVTNERGIPDYPLSDGVSNIIGGPPQVAARASPLASSISPARHEKFDENGKGQDELHTGKSPNKIYPNRPEEEGRLWNAPTQIENLSKPDPVSFEETNSIKGKERQPATSYPVSKCDAGVVGGPRQKKSTNGDTINFHTSGAQDSTSEIPDTQPGSMSRNQIRNENISTSGLQIGDDEFFLLAQREKMEQIDHINGLSKECTVASKQTYKNVLLTKLLISNTNQKKDPDAIANISQKGRQDVIPSIRLREKQGEAKSVGTTPSQGHGQRVPDPSSNTRFSSCLIDPTQETSYLSVLKKHREPPMKQPGTSQPQQLSTDGHVSVGTDSGRDQDSIVERDPKGENHNSQGSLDWTMGKTGQKKSEGHVDVKENDNWEIQESRDGNFGVLESDDPVEPVSKKEGSTTMPEIQQEGNAEDISPSNSNKIHVSLENITKKDRKKHRIPKKEKNVSGDKKRKNQKHRKAKHFDSTPEKMSDELPKQEEDMRDKISFDQYLQQVWTTEAEKVIKDEKIHHMELRWVTQYRDFFLEKLQDPTKKDSPVYRKFKAAFQPGSKLREDEIFPKVKRSAQMISNENQPFSEEAAILGESPMKNLEEIKAQHLKNNSINKNDVIGEDYEFRVEDLRILWEEYNLGFNLMEILSTHLKIGDSLKHLPLNDMTLGAYKQLSNIWHKNTNEFMQGIRVCIGLMGVYEGMRRLNTMGNQISEHTIVENWKLIRKFLIHTNQLTQKESEEIEKYYRLSTRFPKNLNQELPDKPRFKPHLQVKILNSLGIFQSKRQESIWLDDFAAIKNSQLLKSKDDLYLRRIQNGVDIKKVVSIAREIELESNWELVITPGLVPDSFVKSQEGSWFISSERNWLMKIYKDKKGLKK